MNEIILYASVVAATLLVVGIGLWLTLRHRGGSAATRARRESAVLRSDVAADAELALHGVGRGGSVVLHLDVELHVMGGCDVEVGFRRCGVNLDYELFVEGERVAGQTVKLPPDATKIGPDVRAVDTMLPSQRTCVRATVPVGPPITIAPGARITLRGRVRALPDNEVHALTVWMG